MKNRRCRKTIYKKYRRYRCDLWSKIASKRKNNFITNKLYSFAYGDLRRRLRTVSDRTKKITRHFFRRTWTFNGNPNQMYRVNVPTTQRRKKFNPFSGVILKLRRKLSLFYGGGRIRIQTFRRYGRFAREKRSRQLILLNKNNNFLFHDKQSYATIMESRLDVLLFRTNFVDSIYIARHYIFHRKCKVQEYPRISHPSFLVKNYQRFFLKGTCAKTMRKNLLQRMKKGFFIAPPAYLYVNYGLMIAFRIEDPVTTRVSFSFTEYPGALAQFRHAFRRL
jgi:ribosomal protein S4